MVTSKNLWTIREIQVLKRNRTLPEEFAWPSKSKTRKKFICILWCRGPPLIDYSNMGHAPDFISRMSFTTYFYVSYAGELHLYHEIKKNMLPRASPETTWFDQKRTPIRCGKNQDKRLERTRIDQKTTPKRCCKYQDKFRKNPDWSENNADEVHTSSEKI